MEAHSRGSIRLRGENGRVILVDWFLVSGSVAWFSFPGLLISKVWLLGLAVCCRWAGPWWVVKAVTIVSILMSNHSGKSNFNVDLDSPDHIAKNLEKA